MAKGPAGYELAATRLLNRGRKLSSGDTEKREQAELLIAAANTFALLDLASAIRGQSGGATEDAEIEGENDTSDSTDETA